MKKSLILLSLILTIFSCKDNTSSPKENKADVITIDINDSESKSDLSFFDIISDLKVIELKGIPELNQIGRIKKVVQYDGKFLVYDDLKSNILIFNSNGLYERLLGERGAGPQQYERISDFDINKKQNKIYILNNPYLLSYDFNGKFIDKKLLDFYPVKMSVMNDSNIAFNLPTLDDEFCHLIFSDGNGDLISKSACYEVFGGFIGNSRTGGVNSVTSKTYYNYTGISDIYEIDSEYNFNIKFKFNLGADMWPSEKQENVGDFRKRFKSNTVSFLYNSYFINENWMIFEYKISGKENTLKAHYDIKRNELFTSKSFKEGKLIDLLGVPVGLDEELRIISSIDFEEYNELKDIDNIKETIKEFDENLYNGLNKLSLSNTYLLITYTIEK